jgi:hypothetical protein
MTKHLTFPRGNPNTLRLALPLGGARVARFFERHLGVEQFT